MTYHTPDGRASFQFPSSMKLGARGTAPLQAGEKGRFGIMAATPDESLMLAICELRLIDPQPGFCHHMLGGSFTTQMRAVTRPEEVSLGGGSGLRQEFRDAADGTHRILAVAVDLGDTSVLFNVGYLESDEERLRPVCERIIASLTLKK